MLLSLWGFEVVEIEVKTHIITRAAQLAALREQWLELLATSDSNEPVLSPDWLLPWWDIYAPPQRRRLTALSFSRAGRLVGLAPLSCRSLRYRRIVPIRKLDPVGAGEAPEHECCSCYIGLIAERGSEPAVVQAFAEAICARGFPRWHQLQIPEMNSESPIPALLRSALAERGLLTRFSVVDETFFIPLPARYEAYVEGLSYKRRYFVRRTVRDFERWAAGTAQTRHAREPSELDASLAILEHLHRERWESAGEHGAFQSPLFSAFHRRVLAEMMRRKAAEICWLEVHGRPVAALYEIFWDNKVFIYQSGRAMDVPKGIRPGIVLHLQAIAEAIARGRSEYDLLCGDARYKRQLSGISRPLFQLEVWRPSLPQRACNALDRALDLGRALV